MYIPEIIYIIYVHAVHVGLHARARARMHVHVHVRVICRTKMAGAVIVCMFLAASSCLLPAVRAQEQLQVHIVPHTHDDVGWLKTVDEYFYGGERAEYIGIACRPI